MKAWDRYGEELAALAAWEPGLPAARDMQREARANPAAAAVVGEALELLVGVWTSLPSAVRDQALSALRQAAAQAIRAASSAAKAASDAVPLVGALVDAFVQIGEAADDIARIKRDHSNYAHGAAQYETVAPLLQPGAGMYTVVTCRGFAQYVKVRAGGDFDLKPCFSRAGGARDSVFTGVPSPPDDGSCKVKLRRGVDDSYGPMAAPCVRKLGISALLWPWWSAAYEPGPLPRWDAQFTSGGFQLGLSPDTNGRLVGIQSRMLLDPDFNLRAPLESVTGPAGRFFAWWQRAGGVVRPVKDGRIAQGASKRIDATQELRHVASTDAPAYWYMRPDGRIATYAGHADELDRWGVELPAGDPAGLAVTLAQHNAVVDAVGAFAARRLATMRQPGLVEGLVRDRSLQALDAGARAAIEAVVESRDAVLPYPGAGASQGVFRRTTPQGTMGAPASEGGGGTVLLLGGVAVAAGGVYLWRRRR